MNIFIHIELAEILDVSLKHFFLVFFVKVYLCLPFFTILSWFMYVFGRLLLGDALQAGYQLKHSQYINDVTQLKTS